MLIATSSGATRRARGPASRRFRRPAPTVRAWFARWALRSPCIFSSWRAPRRLPRPGSRAGSRAGSAQPSPRRSRLSRRHPPRASRSSPAPRACPPSQRTFSGWGAGAGARLGTRRWIRDVVRPGAARTTVRRRRWQYVSIELAAIGSLPDHDPTRRRRGVLPAAPAGQRRRLCSGRARNGPAMGRVRRRDCGRGSHGRRPHRPPHVGAPADPRSGGSRRRAPGSRAPRLRERPRGRTGEPDALDGHPRFRFRSGPRRASPGRSGSRPASCFLRPRGRDGLRTVIANDLVGRAGDADAAAVICADAHDVERSRRRHSGVAARARADRQLLAALFQVKGICGVLARLVVVRVAFVFVERERGVRPW